MKITSMCAIGGACLAMSASVWAGPIASASVYDLTFRLLSRDGYYTPGPMSFGPPSTEATTVQAYAGGNLLSDGPHFASAPQLYAPISASASVQEGGGTAWSSAEVGAGHLSAAGGTDISSESGMLGASMFAASVSLNQTYGDASIFGGWLTLSPMTAVVMSGQYDLHAEISGPPCGIAECSFGFAGLTLSLGDTLEMPYVAVSGYDGPTFAELIGQSFNLSYSNFTDSPVDLFFQTAIDISGSHAAGIATPVPEPDSLAMLALGLVIVCGLARRGGYLPALATSAARTPGG